MGNTHVRDFYSNPENLKKAQDYIINFQSCEQFTHSQFLQDFVVELNIEKQKDFHSFFDWSNVQHISQSELVEEKIAFQEFKEALMAGNLPKDAMANFFNPAHYDDMILPYAPTGVAWFKERVNQKFILLYYSYYLVQQFRKKQLPSLSSIRKEMNNSVVPKAAEVGIRSGIHLILSLIKGVRDSKPGLTDDVLNFLMELFSEVQPLSLWGNTKMDIVMDRSLHEVVDFLEEIVRLPGVSQENQVKALKVLLSLGLLRGSLPNLLCVVNLLRKNQLQIDMSNEVRLLNEVKPRNLLKFEKIKSSRKVFFKSNVKIDGPNPEKSPYVSITSDGKFLYLFSEAEGIMKIGTGYMQTMFGKVYIHKSEYRNKERGSIAYVLGRLYYRSGRLNPVPLIELNPETLEEMPTPVHYEENIPNSLFPEQASKEIEFPHTDAVVVESSTSSNPGTTQRNQAQQKRDLRLLRPPQKSPIFSDGRYLYIVSQWTVETEARQGDSEDEEEGVVQEAKPARFGVDIYDPLNDFDHIRCVELIGKTNAEDNEEEKSKKNNEKKQKPQAFNHKILEFGSFATNGNHLVVGVPAAAEGNATHGKLKFFNLRTGELMESRDFKDEGSSFYRIHYDNVNNTIWGINDTKKTFDKMVCYTNKSSPEHFIFAEDSDYFIPFENDRIIEIALEGLNTSVNDLSNDGLLGKKLEKQEDLQILLTLGLPIKASMLSLIDAKANLISNAVKNTKPAQLFILSSIARLAEHYAHIDYSFSEEESHLENFRKPYAVHLLPQTFTYLEEFIDEYQIPFFKSGEFKEIGEDLIYDSLNLLVSLRILKHNLAAYECFSEELNAISVKLVSENFPQKLRNLLTQILNLKPIENSQLEEIRKVIYEEALDMLKYNLFTIYENIENIFDLLIENLGKREDTLSNDICISIFSWLNNKRNILKVTQKFIGAAETNKKMLDILQKIISLLMEEEVGRFSNYLTNVSVVTLLVPYTTKKIIEQGMSFLIEFYTEVTYQTGIKVQDKSLENSIIFQIQSVFTKTFAKYVPLAFELIEIQFKRLSSSAVEIITNEYELDKNNTTDKNDKKKKKSLEFLLLEKYDQIWDHINNTFSNKIYFSHLLTLHINAFCLLCSNFQLASQTLSSSISLLNGMNTLYKTRKTVTGSNVSDFTSVSKETPYPYESEHPIASKVNKKEKIQISGAKKLRIQFDSKCNMRMHNAYVCFYSDDKYSVLVNQKMHDREGTNTWPKEDIVVEGDTIYYHAFTDTSQNHGWGYKFTVYATMEENYSGDWFSNLHRTTVWLASKCAAQLINGSSLQQALLQDEEAKYQNILNSKLFSGGIEKCYFSLSKEGLWEILTNIVDVFDAGHLSGFLAAEITQEEKKKEVLLNSVIEKGLSQPVEEFLELLQKFLVKECLWAQLGGETGNKLVRAAFAVIVKHGGLIDDFETAIKQQKEEGFVKTDIFKNLKKKWMAANRMRPWLVEKRKEIDDMAERNRQLIANRKKEPQVVKPDVVYEEKKPEILKKGKERKKAAQKASSNEPEKIKPMIEIEEQPKPQAPIEIKDTEEIIEKMVDQIIKKAQFLLQLVPSKFWSDNQFESKGDNTLLFRSTSKQDENVNKEEEWKRRLLQWKTVRKSKHLLKNLEDESQEVHLSLTTSVLLCLQSPVAIRRLKKQVESAYLRAICRVIGLNAIKKIIIGVPDSFFRQDVIGWICTSLRGSEKKLYHFTDNLQGCGHFLESCVTDSFKNLVIAIIQAMANSNDKDELMSLLEALKWRYTGEDHSYLSEVELFSILRGKKEDSLLRKSWGKCFDIKKKTSTKIDKPLVKKLLELYEIIVTLCVGRLHLDPTVENQKTGTVGKGVNKMPILERHHSLLDEHSSETILRQAFNVLFTELEAAEENYRKFNGVDWNLYYKIQKRKILQDLKDKKKNKGKKVVENEEEYNGEEEEFDEEEEEEPRPRSARDNSESNSSDSEIDEGIVLEEAKIDMPSDEEEKEAKHGNDEKLAKEKKKKQIKALQDIEQKQLEELSESFYNPEFLYRLLSLLHKCVSLPSDQVALAVGNPNYLSTLYRCLVNCPPKHRSLCVKVLGILFQILPKEIFEDSIDIMFSTYELCQNLKPIYVDLMEFYKRFESKESDKNVLIYFLSVLHLILRNSFLESHQRLGEYSFSVHLIEFLRSLLLIPAWNNVFMKLFSDYKSVQLEAKCSENEDKIEILTALWSVLGGQIQGLHTGGIMIFAQKTNEDYFHQNILLRKNFDDFSEKAVIVGFTDHYTELNNEDEAPKDSKKKEEKKKEENAPIHINIGTPSDQRNPLALIYSTINKNVTKISSGELMLVDRYNCVGISEVNLPPNHVVISDKGVQEILLNYFEWAVDSSTVITTVGMNSKLMLLRNVVLKSLSHFLKHQENTYYLVREKNNLLEKLLKFASMNIVSQTDTQPTLYLTEEKLFKMLTFATETENTIADMNNLTITVKNNELEVLLGRTLKVERFPILSGFNLDSVQNYYPLLIIDNVDEWAKNANPMIIKDQMLLVPEGSITTSSPHMPLLAKAAGLIISNFNMNTFMEEYEVLYPSKSIKTAKGVKKQRTVSSAIGVTLPKCIINLSDKYLVDLKDEFVVQQNASFPDILKSANIPELLIEYGFDRQMVENYMLKNPKMSAENLIMELSKEIEAQESEKLKNKNAGPSNPKTQNAQDNKKSDKQDKGKKSGKKDKKKKDDPKKKTDEELIKSKKAEFLKTNEPKNVKKEGEEEKKEDNQGEADKTDKTDKADDNIEEIVSDDDHEEIEEETENSALKCQGEKEIKTALSELNKMYDTFMEFETLNRIGLLILFKQMSFNVSVYYARRCILNILLSSNEDLIKEIIEKTHLNQQLHSVLRLILFEAISCSSCQLNDHLIKKIKSTLQLFYSVALTSKIGYNFLEELVNICITNPIKKLEALVHALSNKEQGPDKQSKKKIRTDILKNCAGSNISEDQLDNGYLDLSLWLANEIITLNNTLSHEFISLDHLFTILGLVPIIRQNKQLVWGVLLFCQNLLTYFSKNLHNIRLNLKDHPLKNPNIHKIFEFYDQSKSAEKSTRYSKRTQILAEFLISFVKFYKQLIEYCESNKNKLNLGHDMDLKKIKTIEDLYEVVKMMETFPDNKSLTTAAWLQASNDLIKNEQIVVDGDHFYNKVFHTFKINLPNAASVKIKFSDESQTDPGDSIFLTSDPLGDNSIQRVSGRLAKKQIDYPSGTFYLHFPARGNDISSFGVNAAYQLGLGDNIQNGPSSIDAFISSDIKHIDAGDSHSVVLLKNGSLWTTGSGSQVGVSTQTAKTWTQIKENNIKTFGCGSAHTLFVQDNKLYGIGNNGEGRLGLNWNSGNSTPQAVDFPSSKTIRLITCGNNHSFIVTEDNQLYVAGCNDHGQLGLTDENGMKNGNQQTFIIHSFFNKQKVLTAAAGQNVSFVIVSEKGNSTTVYAAGEKTAGRLGLGNDLSTNAESFTPIEEFLSSNVINVVTKKRHSAAITAAGELYTWGANECGQLGHESLQHEWSPKRVASLLGEKIISVGVGDKHTIIITRDPKEQTTKAYACGEASNTVKLGNSTLQGKINKPTLIPFFEGKYPIKACCGHNHSFILSDKLPTSKVRDTHNVQCCITKVTPIIGSLYFSLDHMTKEIKYYSSEAIKDPKNDLFLPKLLLFTREALSHNLTYENLAMFLPKEEDEYLDEEFEDIVTQEFKGYVCGASGKAIRDKLFINAHLKEKEDKYDYLCEEMAESVLLNQVSPTIYYRISLPLKKDTELPIIPRTNIYPQSDSFGYHITITPEYTEAGYDYMIGKYPESYEIFVQDMRNIKSEVDEQLVDLLNNMSQKQEKMIFAMSENLTFPKDELNIRSAIEKSSQEFLRKRMTILKSFNSKVKNIIPYIDFSAKKGELNRLRNVFSSASVFIFYEIKKDMIDSYIDSDSKTGNSNLKLKVNRMKARKFIEKGKPDHTGEFTVYGQLFQQIRKLGYSTFKVKGENSPFSVQFVGEASIDAGGPYREAMSQICTELQSQALPLLIQSPNQKNDSGLFREKWILNPSATSIIHMKMYEMFGVFMGVAIRTKNFLNLDLPSFVWKQLVDVPLVRKDLENIDRYTIQCLDDILNINKKGIDEKNFHEYIQEKFVTHLSDGTEVELCPRGRDKEVSFDSRILYADLVEKIRLNESRKQIDAVRKGMCIVLPEGILNLLTWRELETMVCGKPILDVELLKMNTIYKQCSESDSIIEMFWKTLTEFNAEERSMYLRFVWGRSRLPLTSKDFPMKHQIEKVKKPNSDPDMMLPVSHTCFFSIEIPEYSTYEILRDKLLYAITHCQAIDTDGRAYDIWDEDDF